MRYVVCCLGLGGLALLSGCTGTRWGVINHQDHPPQVSGPTPTAAALVKYLDDNAQLVDSLRCDDFEMTVSEGWKSFPLPSCSLACKRPRNFRMTARSIVGDEVDLGSNGEEFWFWIKRADPPRQYHCSYEALSQALASGRSVNLPFPFQPEWVVETLGMGNYGPADRYQLVVDPDKYRLVERVRGPQGNTVRKVIVFNRWQAKGNAPQVTDYQLLDDASGKEICSAHVMEVQGNQSGGTVPRRIELRWPEQKVKMKMHLTRAAINAQVQPQLFVRRPLRDIPSFDLATGRIDGQPSSFQRAGGVMSGR